ncbi:SBBP repeat-containing protein [Sorangium sp. So ce1335]|uniref:SBBP repeat-containing protein n=1 Tax=Sorangium sp. So ce1335 TaxID=3133335 RepID=UPI003F5E5D7B
MKMRALPRCLGGLGIVAVSGCGLVLGLDDFKDAAPAEGATPAGAGGAGGGTTCEPESVAACYSGPSETKDVGICRAGTQACKQDGSGYEACLGEVTPAVETCASTEDEDCDGKDCVKWARLIGGAEDETINGAAVDSAGNIYIAGNFQGAIPLGEDVLIASGERDAFLVKLSASGEYIWGRQLGDVDNETLFSVAVNPQGEVAVVSVEIEDGLSSMNMMLQKYDPDGALLWRKPLGGGMCGFVPSTTSGMVFLPDGDLLLAGSYCGTIRFDDDHVIINDTEGSDVFVVRLSSSDGSFDDESGWGRVLGGDGTQSVIGLVVDPAGNIIVAGLFYEQLVSGDRSYTPVGGSDSYVVKLSNRGLVSWTRILGGPEHDTLRSIAVDRLGGPVVLIGFRGTVDFGGGEFVANELSAALLKYTTSDVYEWGQVFDPNLSLRELFVEPTGDMLMMGALTESVELGGEVLRAKSEQDVLLLKIGPNREPLWARTFGVVGEDGISVSASALGGSGDLLVTGVASGKIDFGTGAMTPQDGGDLFVASLSP